MSQTAALIAEHLEDWGFVPFVVSEVFEDSSPEAIAATLDEFCRRSLGAAIGRCEFFRASVGSVHGLRLRDGRRVVVKVHRPGSSTDFLAAMQTVQRSLAAEGFPCPQPLLGPSPIGRGVAVTESLLDRGGRADAHDPAIRRELVRTLAWLVERCRSLAELDGLRHSAMERQPGRLWPRPHDGRFDFEATSAGAKWIGAIAEEARRVIDRARLDEPVVSHADWRVGNMRFSEGKVSAVYDWDSLRLVPEPEAVGSVAHFFTADFGVPNQRRFPTLAEALAFASEYEAARGKAFTRDEQRALRASLIYSMAYAARCAHADRSTQFGRHAPMANTAPSVREGTAGAFLVAHAAELLDTEIAGLPTVERVRSH